MLPGPAQVRKNLNGLNAHVKIFEIAVQRIKQEPGRFRAYLVLDGHVRPVTLPVLSAEHRVKVFGKYLVQLFYFSTFNPVGHPAPQCHQPRCFGYETGKPEGFKKGSGFFGVGQMVKYHQVCLQKIPFRRKISPAFAIKKCLAFFIHF